MIPKQAKINQKPSLMSASIAVEIAHVPKQPKILGQQKNNNQKELVR